MLLLQCGQTGKDIKQSLLWTLCSLSNIVQPDIITKQTHFGNIFGDFSTCCVQREIACPLVSFLINDFEMQVSLKAEKIAYSVEVCAITKHSLLEPLKCRHNASQQKTRWA